MSLPLVKIGTLILKTVSKPIASRLKTEAGVNPRFRQLIVSIAQANHQITTNMQRRIYGHATDVAIRPLDEDKAIKAATDLIGELFVFTVAGAIVVFEVQRSAASEARKEASRKQEIQDQSPEKMNKDTKMKGGTSSCHQLKEKEKQRVNDLQGILNDLRFAMKESRADDVALLEAQVNQMLKEWNAELNEATPTSSLDGGSLGSFAKGIEQLLQLQPLEEEDDAISPLTKSALKNESHLHSLNIGNYLPEDFLLDDQSQGHGFQGFDQFETFASSLYNTVVDTSVTITSLCHPQFDLHQGFEQSLKAHNSGLATYADFLPHDFKYVGERNNSDLNQINLHQDFEHCEDETIHANFPDICPPPSAFLGQICALWDCFRPAQGNQYYCMKSHAVLAFNEGLPCTTPILRPQGIEVKDTPLFATLQAKAQGKEVGIPSCEGAASAKSPWNAPELFDLSLLKGETIREWLFFDKPKRAFETGNRKQRSLPDYCGRWHVSRKVPMHGGHKRSYYMDPQPCSDREWHLYEYELSDYDPCALYRLELKLVDLKKSPRLEKVCKESKENVSEESASGTKNEKSPEGEVSRQSLADLEKKMGKLSADSAVDDSPSIALGERTKVDPLREDQSFRS